MSTSIPLSSRKPPPRCSLTASTTSSWRVSRSARQPAGHLEPGRVVGEHEVVVAELHRGERHLLDRRAAVGPVGVGVQVAAEQRPQLLAAARRRGPPYTSSSSASRSGTSPRTACPITAAVLVPMPGRLGQRAGLDVLAQLGLGHRQDRGGGGAEGLDLVGVLAGALEQERDPAQRGDRADPAPAMARSWVLSGICLRLSFLHNPWRPIVAGQAAVRRSRPGPVHRLVPAPAGVGPQVGGLVHRVVHSLVHRRHALTLTRGPPAS